MLDRRGLMVGLGALALGGCNMTGGPNAFLDPALQARSMYGPIPSERFPVPAADLSKVDPAFYRRVVKDPTGRRPGTIVVDTGANYLYLVQDDGNAIRYGIGVGRAGFAWAGAAYIPFKRKWPTWTPPPSMIRRQPELAKYASGMEPGLHNPLGARALYLYRGGRDTLYRIHGTNEDWSIGRNVSSGCIRLLNQDIIHLYERTPDGTPVVVLPPARSLTA